MTTATEQITPLEHVTPTEHVTPPQQENSPVPDFTGIITELSGQLQEPAQVAGASAVEASRSVVGERAKAAAPVVGGVAISGAKEPKVRKTGAERLQEIAENKLDPRARIARTALGRLG